MMAGGSLRSRLVSGALLWTLGLFVVTGVVTTVVMMRYPKTPFILHGMFEHHNLSAVVAAVSMLWGLWQVRRGFAPIDQLRARLAAVRDGNRPRIEGRYPSEVQPLVDDLNALLEQRERAVARAVAKAGDLAHGLKTPLAVLAHEAERAAEAGRPDLGDRIAQQVDRMRRQMDYHLAHARAAASGAGSGARSSVGESVEGLARTLQRLHADRGIRIDVHVAADHSVRTGREDLDEMLGNLLDNACKWTQSQVLVESSSQDGRVVITIDDDGPGVAAELRNRVLGRGVRADEAAPGSGFGLAIVRELAEVYGGSIALAGAPSGGLRARLTLPS
jgi:signal transduction histidine kinase